MIADARLITCVRCGSSLAEAAAQRCALGCAYCEACSIALHAVCMNCGGELTPVARSADLASGG